MNETRRSADLPKKKILETLLKSAISYLECLQKFTYPVKDVSKKDSVRTEKRYPKRNIKRLSYNECDSTDDECLVIENYVVDESDTSSYERLFHVSKIPDKLLKTQKAQEIPQSFVLRKSSVSVVKFGVWTEEELPTGIILGPCRGRITKNYYEAENTGYFWMVRNCGKERSSWRETSNWLRFVNFADSKENHNVMAFQYKKRIYYKTCKQIEPFQELLVWYSDNYATELRMFNLDAENVSDSDAVKKVWCDAKSIMFNPLDQELQSNSAVKENKCVTFEYSTDKALLRERHCPESKKAEAQTYDCPNCEKVFLQIEKLQSQGRYFEQSISCDVCGRASKWQPPPLSLTNNTKEKNYPCNICGKRFSQAGNLEIHTRIHTADRPFKCPYCKHSSIQSSHMRQHVIVKHTKKYPIHCLDCGKGFIRPGRYEHHIRKRHSDVKKKPKPVRRNTNSGANKIRHKLKCDFCEYTCFRIFYLQKHLNSKHKEDGVVKMFQASADFAEHLQDNQASCSKDSSLIINEIPDGNLEIDERKSRKRKRSDNTILTSHRKKPRRNTVPEIAQETIEVAKNLDSSVKNLKDSENSLVQLEVGVNHLENGLVQSKTDNNQAHFTSENTDDLKNSLIELQKGGKPYKCPQCEYICNYFQSLTQHIICKHTKRYPYTCAECGNGFTRPVRLQRHIDNVHARIRELKANTKDSGIKRKKQKGKNKVIVTRNRKRKVVDTENGLAKKRRRGKKGEGVAEKDQKPFVCCYCSYACYRPTHLSRHIIKEHTHDYPYVCPQCNEGFVIPKELRDHFSSKHANVKSTNRFQKPSQASFKAAEVNTQPSSEQEKIMKQENKEQIINEENKKTNKKAIIQRDNQRPVMNQKKKVLVIRQDNNEEVIEQDNRKPVIEKDNKEVVIKQESKKPVRLDGMSHFKCPHCTYACILAQHLTQHVIAAHTSDHSYACVQCVERFSNPFRLRHHFKEIHVAKRNECRPIKEETTKIVKKSSKKSKTPQISKIHACQYCEYKCSKIQQLTQHVIVRHTKEYPFYCPKCKKGYTRVARYNLHVVKCKGVKTGKIAAYKD
ncbi:zinc finger protein 493-like [Parasteatoda tepidariorum]|uniref:zinc finger protein 493-like n=1 Tax=Parasteatoda tepidariorum TaxID=114398 RepID=UPI00077F8618|nr:zinc finger protein 729-like [Parasteatoda tepidariorum]